MVGLADELARPQARGVPLQRNQRRLLLRVLAGEGRVGGAGLKDVEAEPVVGGPEDEDAAELAGANAATEAAAKELAFVKELLTQAEEEKRWEWASS